MKPIVPSFNPPWGLLSNIVQLRYKTRTFWPIWKRKVTIHGCVTQDEAHYSILSTPLRGTVRYARVAQHRQQPFQRRPVARLDGLLPRSVPEVPLDHAIQGIGGGMARGTQ